MSNRLRSLSAFPKYAKTTGLGFPFTRRDSTIYQYFCPLDVFAWMVAMESVL